MPLQQISLPQGPTAVLFYQQGYNAQCPSQGQRSNITHEHLGRVTIKPQEPKASANDTGAENSQLCASLNKRYQKIPAYFGIAGYIAQDRKGDRNKYSGADSEAVQAVGKINCVRRTRDYEYYPKNIKIPSSMDTSFRKGISSRALLEGSK